ncbi:hypothetical protein [Pseudactinotalea sp. Z1732]|uniref:hypothetical protein n=1 Tax=Micrococcales TaxID=85006 RepID=UPI003C7DA312
MEVNNHWFTGADGTTWVRLDDAERRVAAVIGQRDQARDIAVALEQENAYLGAELDNAHSYLLGPLPEAQR